MDEKKANICFKEKSKGAFHSVNVIIFYQALNFLKDKKPYIKLCIKLLQIYKLPEVPANLPKSFSEALVPGLREKDIKHRSSFT